MVTQNATNLDDKLEQTHKSNKQDEQSKHASHTVLTNKYMKIVMTDV